MARCRLDVAIEAWPLARPFIISRGSRVETRVVVVRVEQEGAVGRGESVPNARYDETPESTVAAIESMRPALEAGVDTRALQAMFRPGAARNAIDCALWDLAAKRCQAPAWRLAGLPSPRPVETVFTISLDTPEAMAAQARQEAARPILKLKLGGDGDDARVAAVRAAAPDATLIADCNESWNQRLYEALVPKLISLGVVMIEQPFPVGEDRILDHMVRPIPVCADESCHTSADLSGLFQRYDVINIKLDKTGGLSEAINLAEGARNMGLDLMVGCMLGTSLSMAPAQLLAPLCRFVDLDAPLLLARDREPGLTYRGAVLEPPEAVLWG